MEKKSGPQAGVEGVAEDIKGKAKEVGGTALGNDSLKREGLAQQDTAGAEALAGAGRGGPFHPGAGASGLELQPRPPLPMGAICG
jgi:uncharacterized protein YjbJ (UPF0337 family)